MNVMVSSPRWGGLRERLAAIALSRVLEMSVVASLSALLLVMALAVDAQRTGDGEYYYAMLVALAQNGSPDITDAVRSAVELQTGKKLEGLALRGAGGGTYGAHFWAYSAICFPAYWLLGLLGLDGLKAFQLTNAAIVSVTALVVLVLSGLSAATRWIIASGFVLSAGAFYWQWTHPEVFSAACVLGACLAYASRRLGASAVIAALGSLQNPSIALVLPFIGVRFVIDEWPSVRHAPSLREAAARVSGRVGLFLLVGVIAVSPYVWNYWQFKSFNPIVAMGFVDYANINLRRLWSLVFDLNQGLIVGLPMLLWLVPATLALRFTRTAPGTAAGPGRNDILIAFFLVMALPTLGQTNWHAGHTVYIRYAVWSAMALLVWAGLNVARVDARFAPAVVVPAIALQLTIIMLMGGIVFGRQPYYLAFKPWVVPMWTRQPHFYDPLPEIFYEKTLSREGVPATPVVLRQPDGAILRVLTKEREPARIAADVCGSGSTSASALRPVDARASSAMQIRPTEHGYNYVTGRLTCAVALRPGDSITPKSNPSAMEGLFRSGWHNMEATHRWSASSDATMSFDLSPDVRRLTLTIHALVPPEGRQQVQILTDGSVVTSEVFAESGSMKAVVVPVQPRADAPTELVVRVGRLVRPSALGPSSDTRSLGAAVFGVAAD